MKKILLTFFIMGLVEALSELTIYRNLIVPILPTVKEVPFHLWVVLFLPAAITCVFIGAIASDFKQAFLASIAAGISSHLYNYYAAINHFPGHDKSWALTGTSIWLSAGLVLQIAFYFSLIAIGHQIYKQYAKYKSVT